MTRLQEILHRDASLCQLGIERPIGLAPQTGKDRRRQIFRAGHRRHTASQDDRARRSGGRRNARLAACFAEPGQCAQRGDIARPELAPPRQRQAAMPCRPHSRRAAADRDRRHGQTPAPAGPHARGPARPRLVRRLERQDAVRAENGSQCHIRPQSDTIVAREFAGENRQWARTSGTYLIDDTKPTMSAAFWAWL